MTPACAFCGAPVLVLGDGEYSGGGVVEMSFGYGSRHDTDAVKALVCDTCATAIVERAKTPWEFQSACSRPWPNTVDAAPPVEQCEHTESETRPKYCTKCGLSMDFSWYGPLHHIDKRYAWHPSNALNGSSLVFAQRGYRAAKGGPRLKLFPYLRHYRWKSAIERGEQIARKAKWIDR